MSKSISDITDMVLNEVCESLDEITAQLFSEIDANFDPETAQIIKTEYMKDLTKAIVGSAIACSEQILFFDWE